MTEQPNNIVPDNITDDEDTEGHGGRYGGAHGQPDPVAEVPGDDSDDTEGHGGRTSF